MTGSTWGRQRLLLLGLLVLFGCAPKGEVADDVKPLVAYREYPENELLDVAVVVFSSKTLTDEDIEEKGLSEQIRSAEERFIPIHLKYTMQRSGYWGAVRVVPAQNNADLTVYGIINASDGRTLSLDIEAVDARDVVWFRKTYTELIEPPDYNKTVPQQNDSFQSLYNSIANDLARHRISLTADDIQNISQISELRFAEEMVPSVFAGYFSTDNDGRYVLKRLPIEEDPMLKRVQSVQVREELLIDTVNNYYDAYYRDLWQPYSDWRRLRSEEALALKKLQEEALTRKLLGLASIVGAIAVSSGNNDLSRSNLPAVMVMGGAAALYSGFQKSEETKIHKDAIEELSQSFASEAEPLVVNVVGETVRLTGSAEEQYAQWREILQDIYRSETGLPLKRVEKRKPTDREAERTPPAEEQSDAP